MSTIGAAGANTTHANTLIGRVRHQHRLHAAERRLSLRAASSACGALAAHTRNDIAKADLLSAMSDRDTHTMDLLKKRIRRAHGTKMKRIVRVGGTALLMALTVILIGVPLHLLDLGGFTVGRLPLSVVLAVLASHALVLTIGSVWGRETARNRQRLASIGRGARSRR